MDDAAALAYLVLRAGSRIVEGISTRMAAEGFGDLRPAHGFAFSLVSHGGATAGQLAEHLGVTKQAAAAMVVELERRGYLERREHPEDGRARILVLTPLGWSATQAADRAARAEVRGWITSLGAGQTRALMRALGAYAGDGGPLRPAW